MSITDGINCTKVEGNVVLKAKNNPLKQEDIIQKINKIGDTIYEIKNLDLEIDKDAFISFTEINHLRHCLFDQLNELRDYHIKYVQGNYTIFLKDYPREKKTSVLVNEYSDKLDYDIIYSEEDSHYAITKLPKVMHDYDDLDINKEYLVGELGAFNKLKNVYTDYSFNVVNSYTVALLHHLGAKRVTLSLELNHKQIENIVNAYIKRYHCNPNLEVIKSGYREVMTLKTNLNKYYLKDKIFLVDRFNNKFIIRTINNLCYIYEPNKYSDSFNFYSIGINVLRDNKEI
jgi:putative protease